MPVMDEAFLPLSALAAQVQAVPHGIRDDEAGVSMQISRCVMETPIELELVRDEQGRLAIGTTPPLYRLDTSFQPVFHQIRMTIVPTEDDHGCA